MDFTQSDIRKVLGQTAYDRGMDYAEAGRVLRLKADINGETLDNATFIDASVRGSGRNVYEQEIELVRQDDLLYIEGDCTCPVGFNCKHVAAVLLDYLHMHTKKISVWPASLSKIGGALNKPNGGMPRAVSSWVQHLENVVAAATPRAGTLKPGKSNPGTEKKGTVYRLIFVFAPTYRDKRPGLTLCKARLRVNGDIARADRIGDLPTLLISKPAYLRPQEEDLVRLFNAMHDSLIYHRSSIQPSGKIGAQLLRLLSEQDNLWWANSEADLPKGLVHKLKTTAPIQGDIGWQSEGRSLKLGWQFNGPKADRAIDFVLPTTPPWYVDNLSCGELLLPAERQATDMRILHALVEQMAPLEIDNAVMVSQQLFSRGLDQVLPLPVPLHETVLEQVAAEIILFLGSVPSYKGERQTWHDYAMLMFSYDGQQVVIDRHIAEDMSIVRQTPQGLEKIVRDHHAERAALTQLQQAGFAWMPDEDTALQAVKAALVLPDANAWLDFSRDCLPELEAQGWRIKKMANYRFDVAEIEDWYADIDETSGHAWFELELGIVINQSRLPLLPVLVEMIRNAPQDFNPQVIKQHDDSDQLLATLPDGLRVALPWGRIKPILSVLGELYFSDRIGSSLRLSALDAARLEELANGTQLRWLGGERLRSMGKKLAEFGGVQKVPTPAGLQASLREYQSEGLAWMQFLREYDLAGILADDMGLGKTIQTLAHILVEKQAGRLDRPALVVAPTSLMSNWQDEAARFAPELKVLVLQGPERLEHFDTIRQVDLVLTTYALLPRDEEKLRQYSYHLLILDEAHYIKNARSKAAQTAGLLEARHRLCLTGTPLENHLGELWSQFHFLLPGLLGDEKTFNSNFRAPIEKQGNELRRNFLIRRIKPFLLRRTKDKVATELPPKTEVVRNVELSDTQRDLYETVRLAMDKKVRNEIAKKGVARSQIVILEALLKLRQVCCDPRLVKSNASNKIAASSAKLAELMQMIEALREEDRKILVFSQFTSMLSLIEDQLQARNFNYTLLTGETKNRAAAIRSFQSGEVSIFLISLKAGGVGLNLTAADTVIHYDPWWNPAVENQATDRAWRIGQDKPVFVYKLIAKGTLEEKIQSLQQTKADLAAAILSDGDAQKLAITQDDLQAIFAPLE